ncbi:hypothetical protein G6F58_013564 [Rhizopus delemar]|nr:hypothetical protein G6F58_013564 [Rhizopus delemar]
MSELGVVHRLLAHRVQAEQGQPDAEHAADHADRTGFDQALQEDLPTAGSQGAAHADLTAAAQELGQQQAHRVD